MDTFYKDSGDGINVYCVKHLCPLLGDDKYSSRIKLMSGNPILAPNEKDIKPEKQVTISLLDLTFEIL